MRNAIFVISFILAIVVGLGAANLISRSFASVGDAFTTATRGI